MAFAMVITPSGSYSPCLFFISTKKILSMFSSLEWQIFVGQSALLLSRSDCIGGGILVAAFLLHQFNLAAVQHLFAVLDAVVVNPLVVFHAANHAYLVALPKVGLADVIRAAPDNHVVPVGSARAVLVLVIAVHGDAEAGAFLAARESGDFGVLGESPDKYAYVRRHLSSNKIRRKFVDDCVRLVLDGLAVNRRQDALACSDERTVDVCELPECRQRSQVGILLFREPRVGHVLAAAVADSAVPAAVFQVADGRGVREHPDIVVIIVRVLEEPAQLCRAAGERIDALDREEEFLALDLGRAVLHAVDFHQRLDDLQPERLGERVYLFLDVIHKFFFYSFVRG